MKNIISSLFLFSALSLTGCGGGKSKPIPPPIANLTETGMFIDAPVAGLKYNASPSGETGTTNPAGEFKYKDGDTVTFLMGALELGDGVPDADKIIKITQLDNPILVGQLLQTLDINADENKIDVTGITIPDAINTAILDKLENGSVDDVLSPADLVEIKASNADIIATDVKTKADVAAHIVGQIGDQSLIFTEAELNNHLFVSSDALSYANDAMIVRFDEGRQLRWIDGDQSPLSHYSKHDWAVVGGKIEIMFTNNDGSANKCIATKFSEDATTVDASVSCESSPNALIHFLKPRPFSVSDLSGKDITVNGDNQPLTLTFNTDGTYDTSDTDDDDGKIYKDTRYNNSIWLSFNISNTNEGGLFMLAEGTISNGTLVMIEYDTNNNFNGVGVLKTNGNIWTIIHGLDDVSVDANNITSGTVSFTGDVPANTYVRIVPQAFQQDNGNPNYGDGLRCKVQADGTWGTQDCLISRDSYKSAFTTDVLYQFLVFDDSNHDTHFNLEEEGSVCAGLGDTAWNSWAVATCN